MSGPRGGFSRAQEAVRSRRLKTPAEAEISKGGPRDVEGGPADQHATPMTRRLLAYLSKLSRSSSLELVFGHQLDTTSGESWTDPTAVHNRSDTFDSVGDFPGLFGFNGFTMVKQNDSETSIAVARALPLTGIISLHFPEYQSICTTRAYA